MLRHVPVGAGQQHAVVGVVGARVPHLLAVDDPLVAVELGAGGEPGEVGPAPGSLNSWHHVSSPVRIGRSSRRFSSSEPWARMRRRGERRCPTPIGGPTAPTRGELVGDDVVGPGRQAAAEPCGRPRRHGPARRRRAASATRPDRGRDPSWRRSTPRARGTDLVVRDPLLHRSSLSQFVSAIGARPHAIAGMSEQGNGHVDPARRTMAASERSTSSSVVAHDETLMRIAARPCHTVPPHQQVPSACTARDHAPGACVVAERDQHLVGDDVVQHLVAGGAQALGEAVARGGSVRSTRSATPGAAEGAQRRPDLDAARPPRHLRHVVVRLAGARSLGR